MNNPNLPELKTSNKQLLWVGSLVFVLLFFVAGGWMYFAKLSGAVVAQGIVVVTGKPKTVQHLDGGIVSKFFVFEGDIVDKDDLLLSLDEKLLRINLEINSSKLREQTARRARLTAERDDQIVLMWNSKLLSMLGVERNSSVELAQKKLFLAGISARDGQKMQLQGKIIQHQRRIEGLKNQTNSLDAQIGMINEELEGLQKLKAKGLIANTKLLEFERDREELIRQKSVTFSDLDNANNLINETKLEISQIGLEFRQAVLKELSVLDQETNDSVQQIYAVLEKLERVQIRAPVGGQIHEMKVFTIGGVVSPGESIMQIIPHDGAFEVELKVETQFIDDLFTGQEANLRFSAFNQKTTPEILGKIKTISANSIENLQTGIPYFKVNISIPIDQLGRLEGKQLIPGMPVEAFIKTRERTALNYLLKPLLDQMRHALREE